MLFTKLDTIVLTATVLFSCGAFAWPSVRHISMKGVSGCRPCDRILFYAKQPLLQVPDNINLQRVSTMADLLQYNATEDDAKVQIEESIEGCSLNITTSVFRCSGKDLLNSMLDCFPFETDFNISAQHAGFRACKAAKEISTILDLRPAPNYEPWQSVYPTLRQLYFTRFEQPETAFRTDELFAIFMPLLLPPAVMLVRILLNKT